MISGQGLHGGRPSAVTLERAASAGAASTLLQGGIEVPLSELSVVESARSTTVSGAGGRVRVGTVEHLFAALAAHGARRGVRVVVEGDEVPLADGGARTFCDALVAIGARPSSPSLRVVREGTIEVGSSSYRFSRGEHEGERDGVSVEVEVDFDDVRLGRSARWDGDAQDFRQRIATARTFGFAREVGLLLDRGLANHVTPESVVVLTTDGVLCAGRPFEPDEPARHKLLDLVGDLFVHGGPPRGRVFATRPGHAATHEAVRAALSIGLLSFAI